MKKFDVCPECGSTHFSRRRVESPGYDGTKTECECTICACVWLDWCLHDNQEIVYHGHKWNGEES